MGYIAAIACNVTPELCRTALGISKMLRRILEYSRLVFLLPVIGSLILTITVVVNGLAMILLKEWTLIQKGDVSTSDAKQITIAVIQTIDMFLVGAICYIIAVGFYRLFIRGGETSILPWIKIEKLTDLENKIIGMAVVALSIAFLGKAIETDEAQTIFYSGIGISLMIGALCLFTRFSTVE